jgi:hypothetical protein
MSVIKTVIKTTNKGGRPRKHPDRRAAWAAASRAYRKRERAARTKRKAYHSSGECEWYTPASVYQPILERLSMTEFDLDPCSPWLDGPIPAKTRYTPADNGLLQPWQGVVWCNPPYGGRIMAAWCDKAIQEARKGARVIILAHCMPGPTPSGSMGSWKPGEGPNLLRAGSPLCDRTEHQRARRSRRS